MYVLSSSGGTFTYWSTQSSDLKGICSGPASVSRVQCSDCMWWITREQILLWKKPVIFSFLIVGDIFRTFPVQNDGAVIQSFPVLHRCHDIFWGNDVTRSVYGGMLLSFCLGICVMSQLLASRLLPLVAGYEKTVCECLNRRGWYCSKCHYSQVSLYYA